MVSLYKRRYKLYEWCVRTVTTSINGAYVQLRTLPAYAHNCMLYQWCITTSTPAGKAAGAARTLFGRVKGRAALPPWPACARDLTQTAAGIDHATHAAKLRWWLTRPSTPFDPNLLATCARNLNTLIEGHKMLYNCCNQDVRSP